MGRRPKWTGEGIPIDVVPAASMPPNPENPYDDLSPQERRIRIVALFTRILNRQRERDEEAAKNEAA